MSVRLSSPVTTCRPTKSMDSQTGLLCKSANHATQHVTHRLWGVSGPSKIIQLHSDFTGEKPEAQRAEQGLWQIQDGCTFFDMSPVESETYTFPLSFGRLHGYLANRELSK